jgi:hypothetical protein
MQCIAMDWFIIRIVYVSAPQQLSELHQYWPHKRAQLPSTMKHKCTYCVDGGRFTMSEVGRPR